MAEQVQKQKQETAEKAEAIRDLPGKSEKGEKLKAELDELLDEIEDVLEENATQLVHEFVQKGGE